VAGWAERLVPFPAKVSIPFGHSNSTTNHELKEFKNTLLILSPSENFNNP